MNQTGNCLYAIATNDNTYGLVLNEYITILGINETPTTLQFSNFANKNSNPFLVIISDSKSWKSFMETILNLFKKPTINITKEKGVISWLNKIWNNKR